MKQVFFVLVLLASIATVSAQLQIGTRGSNDLIPQISISTNRIGEMATVTVDNVAPEAQRLFLLLGTGSWREGFPLFGPGAFLMVRPDPDPTKFLVLEMQPQGSLSFLIVGGLPIVYIQAVAIDPGGFGGIALSPPRGFSPATPFSGSIGKLDPGRAGAASVIDPRTGIIYVIGGTVFDSSTPPYNVAASDEVVEINQYNPLTQIVRVIGRCPGIYRDPMGNGYTRASWDSRRNVALFSGYAYFYHIMEFNPDTKQCYPLEDTPFGVHIPAYDDVTGRTYLIDAYPQDPVAVFDPSLPQGQRVWNLQVGAQWLDLEFPGGAAIPDPSRTGSSYFITEKPYTAGGASMYLVKFTPGGPQGGFFERIYSEERPIPWPYGSPWPVSYANAYHPAIGLLTIGGYLGFDQWRLSHVLSDEIINIDINNPQSGFATINRMPQKRNAPTAVTDLLTGFVWIIGGTSVEPCNNPSCYVGALTIFDSITRTPRNSGATLPFRASGLGAARDQVNKKVYLVGGNGGSLEDARKIIVFDEQAGLDRLVTVLPDLLPQALTYPATAFSGGKIYVFGGLVNNGLPTNTIYQIDPVAPHGSRVTLLPETLPYNVDHEPAVTDQTTGKVYIFGSSAGYPWRTDITEFDPSQPAGNRVRVLSARLPSARTSFSGAYGNNAIYLFGGWGDNNPDRQIIKFTPSTGQVENLGNILPEAIYSSSAVYDPGTRTFLLFGGENSSSEIDKIYQYNPQSNGISIAGHLPTPRSQTAAALIPGQSLSLIFGGRGRTESYNDVVAFSA